MAHNKRSLTIAHYQDLELLIEGEWFSAKELSEKAGKRVGVRGLRSLTKRGLTRCDHVHKGDGPHNPCERFKITARGLDERVHGRMWTAEQARLREARVAPEREPVRESLLPARDSNVATSGQLSLGPPMQGNW